jgi:hypothetical protein
MSYAPGEEGSWVDDRGGGHLVQAVGQGNRTSLGSQPPPDQPGHAPANQKAVVKLKTSVKVLGRSSPGREPT